MGLGGHGLGLPELGRFRQSRLAIASDTGDFELDLGLGGLALFRQSRLATAREMGFGRTFGFGKDDALGEA